MAHDMSSSPLVVHLGEERSGGGRSPGHCGGQQKGDNDIFDLVLATRRRRGENVVCPLFAFLLERQIIATEYFVA